MTTKKIALFIDADNISAKFGKQIIETLESRGEIFIRRIYGNWEKISLHGWNECILNFSLRAVQQPDFATGKNATDMSLAIDAMDVLYGGKAEIFVLVSNDSDFTPLVIRLREGGMNVIGMGNENASLSFRNACNEFIDFDKVQTKVVVSVPVKISENQKVQSVPKVSPTPVKSFTPKIVQITDKKLQSERDKKIRQLHNVLRESAKIHGDARGFFMLNQAGMEIKNKNLGFGVKNLGYGTLQEFISAFPKLYEVQKTGNIVLCRCLTNEQKNSAANDKFQKIHKILRDTANSHGNLNGFTDLCHAGNAIANKNLSIKGSGYGTLQKFIAAFPKLYELHKNKKRLYYRCK
ncbi:MAG: NYN domain-containing protein [Selenomonadaceae bacterium]|nr:NYN domain-containing protein [Selenomonadaceae bacterium]